MLKIVLVVLVIGFIGLIYRLIAGQGTAHLITRRFGPTWCRMVGHRRRGDAVRKVDGVYHSRCRRCGVHVTKTSRDQEWQVVTDDIAERAADGEHGIPADRASAPNVLALVVVCVAAALTIGLIVAPRHIVMRETAGEASSRIIGALART